jgi:hypothetical protein
MIANILYLRKHLISKFLILRLATFGTQGHQNRDTGNIWYTRPSRQGHWQHLVHKAQRNTDIKMMSNTDTTKTTGDEPGCSRRVSSSCFLLDASHGYFVSVTPFVMIKHKQDCFLNAFN